MSEHIPLKKHRPTLDVTDPTSKVLMDELRKLMIQDPEAMLKEITEVTDPKSDYQKLIDSEFNELTETVKFIRDKFESNRVTFRIIDSKGIPELDSNGELSSEEMDSPEPQWESFREVRCVSFCVCIRFFQCVLISGGMSRSLGI